MIQLNSYLITIMFNIFKESLKTGRKVELLKV
jgi:hypothetical protein